MKINMLKIEQLLDKDIFLLIIFILTLVNDFELIVEYNIPQIK